MEIFLIAIVAAAVFGLCYLVDKAFTGVFRGTPQHASGRSVRVNKRYGSIGLIIAVLGLASMLAGLPATWLLIGGGVLLLLLGIGMVTYYMTFGIYYDDDQFVLTTFGKRSKIYYFQNIRSQQLFESYGNIVIELQMDDGRSVQLHSTMIDVYPFLDHAFAAWLRQTGRKQEDCPFYDPNNSCWFPTVEE